MMKKQIDEPVEALKLAIKKGSSTYERMNSGKIEAMADDLLSIISAHIKTNSESKSMIKYWIMVNIYDAIVKTKQGGFTINEKET